MTHFKDNTKKPKFSKENRQVINTVGGDCDQFPTFSFRHLTPNSRYKFGYYGSNQTAEMKEAKYNLYDRIEDLCKKSWKYWGSLGKKNGYETIDFSRLNFSPSDLEIPKDEKVYIFRFKVENDTARIIGYKKGACPIFHVIGYDLDFSAYNHGS